MRNFIQAFLEFNRILMPIWLGLMIGYQLHSYTWGIFVMAGLSYLDPREAKHV